jgi:hypothetical protein
MSHDRAKREGFQERGAQAVESAIHPAESKPLASLLDFAPAKTTLTAAQTRLAQLREELAAVMCLPGVGKIGTPNKRAVDKLISEIAECRKILGRPIKSGVN